MVAVSSTSTRRRERWKQVEPVNPTPTLSIRTDNASVEIGENYKALFSCSGYDCGTKDGHTWTKENKGCSGCKGYGGRKNVHTESPGCPLGGSNVSRGLRPLVSTLRPPFITLAQWAEAALCRAKIPRSSQSAIGQLFFLPHFNTFAAVNLSCDQHVAGIL